MHLRNLVLAFTLPAMVAFAQVDRSSLKGTVYDQSHRAVPHAEVVATNAATGTERRTNTTSKGGYQLLDLPIGTWKVVFSASGFRSLNVEGVEQVVGKTRTLDPVLSVAGGGEQVTIRDSVAHLDETKATLGEALEQRAIQDLPLNGRNWTSLTALVPGAIDSGGSTQRSIRFTGRGRDEMNITYDGVDATGIVNQAQKAYVRLAIPVSSIAEFHVDSVLPTAEYGDASGAQIAVASMTGGNGVNGSFFEYLRNSAFDARSTFDQTQGPLPFRLNQFGATLGGPVRKNRTFFFLDYEGIRQVQDQTLIGFVPAAAIRAQVLAQSPALAPIVNAYPAGTGSIGATGIQQRTATAGSSQQEASETIRIDERFTDATTGYVRFGYDDATTVAPLGVLADRQLNNAKPLNGVAELLHVFSPAVVNEFRFGDNQVVSHAFNLTTFPYTVNVSGFSALNPSQTSNQDGRTFAFMDSVSVARARHVLKAGVEVRRVEINEGSSFTGTLGFNSIANFVANAVDSAAYTALLPLKRMRKTAYFGYVQDEFRLRPNLTINAGLRYEFYNDFHETMGRAIPFDFQSCGGFCAANAPFLFPAKNNIDPRIGIAWAHGRIVVRAGYGLYHEDAQLDDQNFPTANDQPRYSLSRGAQFPSLSYPFEGLLANATGVLSPKDQVRQRKDTYAQQWIAGVQENLGAGFIGNVSFIGNKGTNMMNRTYTNTINPLTATRPYPQFGQIELRAKDGNSNFSGLQAGAKRALRRGWLLSANYMWSHAMNEGNLGSGVEDDFPQNVGCRACERSSSDQDARQSFSMSSVYELPFRHVILRGWEFSGIAGGRTGLPVNITVDRTSASVPDGNAANQRPNYTGGALNLVSSFAVPAAGAWGNLGHNAWRGPALWQVDSALQRRIVLRERLALVVRAECFNVLNRAQYGNQLADISVPSTFGRSTTLVNSGPVGSGTPRQFEFAMKLVY